MVIAFSAEEIGDWIYDEYKATNPDIVIPTGNRIFNLLFFLSKKSKKIDEIYKKTVEISAISYMNCENRTIMLVDEETEYGRKFLYDVYPHFKGISPKLVKCFTVFLRDDSKAKKEREIQIQKWKEKNPHLIELARSLKAINSYTSYFNSEKFHSAIFNFREFTKTHLRKPYNMDATLFSLHFDKTFDEIQEELNKFGPVVCYDENTFSLFPNFFDPQGFNNINGIQIIDECPPKLRFFKSDDKTVIVSPMAYFSVNFSSEKPISQLDISPTLSDYPLLHKIFKLRQKYNRIKADDKRHITQLYDLLVFWLDIELFRNFVINLKRIELDFELKVCEHGFLTHYGRNLGNKLLNVIKNEFESVSQCSLDSFSKINHYIDAYNINTDIATLLSIKAACLEEYSREKLPSFKREGLTFSAIKKRLKLDPFSTSICIDLLCDNTFLKPFDKIEENLQVARFYNTDIEDFIGIFTKLFNRAENNNIPMGRTNLNKFTTFLYYFAIAIEDKYENPLKIRSGPHGKVIYVIDNEKNIDDRLEDLFTNYCEYRGKFSYEGGKYRVKDEKARGTLEHLDIIESEAKLDSYIDIIIDIYKMLGRYIDEHPEILDSKGNKRTIYDVFPGFIDLLGKGYPEGGLKIIGTLSKRALNYYLRYLKGDSLKDGKSPKVEADKLLFHVIPHKIKMYQEFSEIYLECYKYLSDPYISVRRDVWKSMCVYPSDSITLKFCHETVDYIKREINHIFSSKTESSKILKLENLEKKIEKFLDLMIECSIGSPKSSSIVRYLPKGKSNDLYIVSVDLENSTKISELEDPRWHPLENYLRNIMYRWVETYGGKFINIPGDEIIVAFKDFPTARSFLAGCCTQITEICKSVNQCKTFGPYEVGCYGRMTHGSVFVDEYKAVDSKEINMMCKYLPKKVGKVVIDALLIKECLDVPSAKLIEEKRSYCIIDPKEEFRNILLSEFK